MSDSLRKGFYELGIGDAATVVVGERLYCVGGFRVEYDADLKLFYQSPQVRAGYYFPFVAIHKERRQSAGEELANF